MPPDRMLNNVLQHYQDVHDETKTDQIIGSTVHLLTDLSNPLNLSLLTSHFLTAPAIWDRPDPLRIALRIISVYNTAAARLYHSQTQGTEPGQEMSIGCDPWTRAVVKGADERSARWKHLLVLTGVLMGMEGEERRALSASLRNLLSGAVITAANLALETHELEGPTAIGSIILALNYAFPLLSPHHQSQINCNALLPALVWAVADEEGLRHGEFLDVIGNDVQVLGNGAMEWSTRSLSFQQMQYLDQRPLMNIMGPLSRLATFAVQNASDTRAVVAAQETLLRVSKRMLEGWNRCPFNDIDPAAESSKLTSQTLQETWPALWQLLRKALFGIVAILQAIVSRSLLDPVLLHPQAAVDTASRSLHVLRCLSFISSRNGNNAFQVYTFAHLTSIDVVSRNAKACERFLRETRPAEGGQAATTHLSRTLDLFYLTLSEHLPLTLSTPICEELIIRPATAYISHNSVMTPAMVELFESAHSAILSVLSCPQHSDITIHMAPFYIVKLFESFPLRISPRQFRVAFKTVMQIVSPPFPIANMEPHLSETLLEMLRTQALSASPEPLPETPDSMSRGADALEDAEPTSEQSALALALIDSLPFLPLPLLAEWLTVAAEVLNSIADYRYRGTVRKRFLDILVSGELDVERAAVGVAWWGTKGGREMVTGGARQPAMMSGALAPDEHQSRL